MKISHYPNQVLHNTNVLVSFESDHRALLLIKYGSFYKFHSSDNALKINANKDYTNLYVFCISPIGKYIKYTFVIENFEIPQIRSNIQLKNTSNFSLSFVIGGYVKAVYFKFKKKIISPRFRIN